MPPTTCNKSKIIPDMMKASFHHRAFYCFLGMSVWIFVLITVMYRYMSVEEQTPTTKKIIQREEHLSKSDIKFHKIYLRACNPPENIVRGSEGVVDGESWVLQGVLALTRHGDRGPLTHLRHGARLPCDERPDSTLINSYEAWVANSTSGGRVWWTALPGPFHGFPALPPRAPATRCALGQLTARGLLQMVTVGNILKQAYSDKLALSSVEPGKKENGEAVTWSTRYRRTFQSVAGLAWGLWGPRAGPSLAAAREAPSVAFCGRYCACRHHHTLTRKINSQAKHRLQSHPAIRELVVKLSKVLFESQENTDADVVRDALLAYMCHDAPLPCSQTPAKPKGKAASHKKKFRRDTALRSLLEVDIDTLNMELDYINNQLDFNNEIGRKARDIIGKIDSKDKQKIPLDFDAQMEKEKLIYYQQKYLDNADTYDDVVIVKKNLDADFNFPNDAKIDTDFDEDYKEPTPETVEDFCIKKEHVMSLFAYLEWCYRQEIKNVHNRRRGLLLAYGLIHNIVQNMIRMISENKPKYVLYSGHDKTLQALILALGLTNYQHYNIQYAARVIFEVYRKKDLTDEFKFTKRKAVAQDFYFRVVYNGEDITNKLSFCRSKQNIVMNVENPVDDIKIYKTYLCPIENIVRFIHDDYFAVFNATNFKDACTSYGNTKKEF